MLKEIYKESESHMKGAIQALEDDLDSIRTGRASPALVERLHVDYYGSPTPLVQLASINVPEPRSLLIRPFDPSTLRAIERAILVSDLGLTPNNDGKAIRLNLPPLTEEMREYEQEKLLSEDERALGEEQLQKITDRFIQEVTTVGERKEKEIMEV